MRKIKADNRLVIVLTLFFLMLFHQADNLLIVPMAQEIGQALTISESRIEDILDITLFVSVIFFPVWGYFADRHSRNRLLALGCFLWGVTSQLTWMAPTFLTFAPSVISGGIDAALRPGVFSLIGDYFSPKNRGKIFGLIQLTEPLAYFGILLLNFSFSWAVNWRIFVMVSGIIGLVMAVLVFTRVKEPKRGASEPALASIKVSGVYRFDWETAQSLLRKPGLMVFYFYGLFAIIPWSITSSWLFAYLGEVRGMTIPEIMTVLSPTLISIALGYPIGGLLGDAIFRSNKRGRIIVSMISVTLSGICLFLTLHNPRLDHTVFMVMMILTGFFMALDRPNVVATVFDTTLPEVRSMAISILFMAQVFSTLLTPYFVESFAKRIGLGPAILVTCLGAWGISFLLLIGAWVFVPRDIEVHRRHMAYRSRLESRWDINQH